MNSSLTPAILIGAAFVLAGCSTAPPRSAANPSNGKYYLNDGPMKGVSQAMLDAIPNATPRHETLSKGAKKPYGVMGRRFVPMTAMGPYKATGVASWYGTRYHGLKTATGETYDMLKMTAAHPTLPLPSYARVTNLGNNRSVIVRVNDRGPFLHGRIIDLSFAAANRLGYTQQGSASVEVELIEP